MLIFPSKYWISTNCEIKKKNMEVQQALSKYFPLSCSVFLKNIELPDLIIRRIKVIVNTTVTGNP